MNPHRVEVLNGTDDDDVVFAVAHDLELVFLPAEDRFLEQDCMLQAGFESARGDLAKLIHVVRGAAAGAAKRIAGAHDNRKSDPLRDFLSFFEVVHHLASQAFEPGFGHRGLEQLPVFGALDDLRVCANHFHAILLKDSALGDFK